MSRPVGGRQVVCARLALAGLCASLCLVPDRVSAGPPDGDDAASVAAPMLQLVNATRKAGRTCGDRRFEPAPAVSLSAVLSEVALRHARDMATRGRLDHVGSDGSHLSERVSNASYDWTALSENIAVGQSDAAAVVVSWLESPGHCENIMGRQFTEMGVGAARAATGAKALYWAQVFAAQ